MSVAMPDSRPRRFSTVRSAVSRVRAEPLIAATSTVPAGDRVAVGDHRVTTRRHRIIFGQGPLRAAGNPGHDARSPRAHGGLPLGGLGHQGYGCPIVQPGRDPRGSPAARCGRQSSILKPPRPTRPGDTRAAQCHSSCQFIFWRHVTPQTAAGDDRLPQLGDSLPCRGRHVQHGHPPA